MSDCLSECLEPPLFAPVSLTTLDKSQSPATRSTQCTIGSRPPEELIDQDLREYIAQDLIVEVSIQNDEIVQYKIHSTNLIAMLFLVMTLVMIIW